MTRTPTTSTSPAETTAEPRTEHLPVLADATAAPTALTPAALIEVAGRARTSRAYLYQLREEWGCHGSDVTGYLLSAVPHTYDDLDKHRTHVAATLRRLKAERTARLTADAGPKPVFDRAFDGVRSAYEAVLTAWTERRNGIEASVPEPDEAALWAELGYTLVDTDNIQAANSEYLDADELDDPHTIFALGHEDTHGCRCMCDGRALLYPDEEEDPRRFTPRPVLVITAGPWHFLARPDLAGLDDVSLGQAAPGDPHAAPRALYALARTWQDTIDAAEHTARDLAAQIDALPTPEDLAGMRPVEYEAAQELLRTSSSLNRQLSTARGKTLGAHLRTACSRLGLAPLIPGFNGRVSTGHRRGDFASVADVVCRTPKAPVVTRAVVLDD